MYKIKNAPAPPAISKRREAFNVMEASYKVRHVTRDTPQIEAPKTNGMDTAFSNFLSTIGN